VANAKGLFSLPTILRIRSLSPSSVTGTGEKRESTRLISTLLRVRQLQSASAPVRSCIDHRAVTKSRAFEAGKCRKRAAGSRQSSATLAYNVLLASLASKPAFPGAFLSNFPAGPIPRLTIFGTLQKKSHRRNPAEEARKQRQRRALDSAKKVFIDTESAHPIHRLAILSSSTSSPSFSGEEARYSRI
jgi:hypothetical protein